MATLDDSLIGKVIDGRFLITRHLGMGGMGTAFLALQTDLNRSVCVKFLKSEVLSDLESVSRFKREARVLATMKHPHIVECYAFGLFEKMYPYLVMEFIEGTSLNLLAQTETIEWDRACRLVMQICAALTYAHQRGFIHRDIKTQNVMVTCEDGKDIVKVVDFGLVGKQRGELVFDTLTDPRSILGSVNYMAPEAFKGIVPDATLDIYAVGCLLYELLSGQIPFEAENSIAVMYKHVSERLPELPANIGPAVIRGSLEDIIWTATAKLPLDRFSSCEQMNDALNIVLEHNAAGGRVAPVSRQVTAGATRSAGTGSGKYSHGRLYVLLVAVGALLLSLSIVIQAKLQANHSHSVAGHAAQFGNRVAEGAEARRNSEEAVDQFLKRAAALDSMCNRWVEEKGKSTKPHLLDESQKSFTSLRTFLQRFAYRLDRMDERVSRLTEHVCYSLSRMNGYMHDDPVFSRELATLQCDLLTSLGYYENSLTLLRNATPLPLSVKLRRNDPDKFTLLHDYVFESDAQKSYTDSFLVDRLRPAASAYLDLRDDGTRFMEFVSRFSHHRLEDHWTPSLYEIAKEIKRTPDESIIVLWLALAERAAKDKKPEIASTLIAQVSQQRSRYPMVGVGATARVLQQLGKSDEALAALQNGSDAARRRGDLYDFCLFRSQFADILIDLNRTKEATAVLNGALSCDQWRIVQDAQSHGSNQLFTLIRAFGMGFFKCEDYAHATSLFRQAWKLSNSLDKPERSVPDAVGISDPQLTLCYVQSLWHTNCKKEADATVEAVLRQAESSNKIEFAKLLRDWGMRYGDVGEHHRCIDMILRSTRVLASLLKQPRISAGDSQQVEELLANVHMELARRYADRRDNERALEINRRVFDGKSGKIDAHERAGLLLTIARNQERLGFTSLAEQTMEHVVDLLQKIPCWTQADYRTFQASITERCCIAAKFGNPRTAIRFLEEKHLQFAKTSITIDCYLLARLAIVSTWGPVPDNDIGLHCLPSCRALYDAMPVPSNEETEFRSAVRWLMADMEHCFQNYGREEKIAEQLFIDYKPEQSLERVDVYCRLALVSADRGDLRNEVRYLEKAAAQPAASKDKIVRINWAMADVLGEQGHFNKARSYLQQLKEELAEKQKTKKERDWCLLNLALAHENLLAGESKFEDAYRILLKSLDILEACEKRSNEVLSSNLLGLFYARLAFAAQRVGQSGQPYLELCLKKLRDPKNIKLWGANECRYQTGICLFRQAKFYRGRNQDRTALPLLREAVAYPSHEVCILVLAEVEAALGNDKLAASYYSDALAHLNKTGDTNSVNRFVRGLTYVSYACWLHDRGDQKGADDYADRGLALLPEHRCRQSSDRDILLVDLKRMSKWHHSSTDKLKSLIALIEARRGF